MYMINEQECHVDYSALMPAHLQLGGTRYELKCRSREWYLEHQVHGQCRWPDMEVDLVTEGQKASEVANTLIHECLHLCYREWNIKPGCGEERTVTSLGFAITALYTQNPDLLTAIQSLLEYSNGE